MEHYRHLHPQGKHYPDQISGRFAFAAYHHQNRMRSNRHLPKRRRAERARHSLAGNVGPLTPDTLHRALLDLPVLRHHSLIRRPQLAVGYPLRPDQPQVHQHADHRSGPHYGMLDTHSGICTVRFVMDVCMKDHLIGDGVRSRLPAGLLSFCSCWMRRRDF